MSSQVHIWQHCIGNLNSVMVGVFISLKLADYMNLSPSFIADIENPKRRAKYNLNHLNELAKVFSCSPKDFLPDTPLKNEK